MNSKEQIRDYSSVLDAKYGKVGTSERAKFEEEAYSFYTGQLLKDARKQAHVTQAELAERIDSTKSYISRVENGDIIPSVGMFYKLIHALGMRVEIVSSLA